MYVIFCVKFFVEGWFGAQCVPNWCVLWQMNSGNFNMTMLRKKGYIMYTSFFWVFVEDPISKLHWPNSPASLTVPLWLNGWLIRFFWLRLFFIFCQIFAIFDDFSKSQNIFSIFHFEKWQKFGGKEKKSLVQNFSSKKIEIFSAILTIL